MGRTDGSLCISLQKYLVLCTTELALWTSSFSPEKTGAPPSSVFQEYHLHFHFLSLYSFYLNKKYGNSDCLG
jgi:hypothetical protein